MISPRVFLILAAIFSASAYADEGISVADAEKMLQARKPFSSAKLSAESSRMENIGVGDIIVRRNPMHPDFEVRMGYNPYGAQQLSDGSVVASDIDASAIAKTIAGLESQFNSTQGFNGALYAGYNSITNSIRLYLFEWANERKVERRVSAPLKELAAEDVRCLCEAAAAAFSAARAEASILSHLKVQELQMQYSATDDAEAKAQASVDGNKLVIRFANVKGECRAAGVNQLRQELKRIYGELYSPSQRELHALQEALDLLDKGEAKPLGGSVIEARVAQKAEPIASHGRPAAAVAHAL